MKRFQGDTQWQRDFGNLALAIQAQKERVAACKRLHDAGDLEGAREELRLADEAQELIAMLEHALRDIQ
jgi:hypothetical protein